MAEGTSSSDALPVVHRLSPCSPLGTARNQQMEKPSVADVLHRDALRLRSLFQEHNHGSRFPAPAPTSAGGGLSIPSRGDPIQKLPGALEYHVIAWFGTPVQQFTLGFDTTTPGASLLRCKPCAANEPCDHAFDPSASSSIAQVPCGSPDCPFKGCSGPSCTLSVSTNNTLLGNATFFTDKLTLTPWNTVDSFRFACLEAGFRPADSSTGILDLSRNSHSLASRAAPSSPDAVAFSYCLPSYPSDVGFLSLGATKPELLGRKVSYTPLRSNPHNGNLYVVELVGLGLGGVDLPIPRATIARGGIVLSDSLGD
ncbi:aspartyl protease AED3-like [Miscanthus floridulus]|uniref:aspartyl protease AED3-like n=1 Tax=Miscanthus floridulus TaxID=154761 RepID=UPI00345A013B